VRRGLWVHGVAAAGVLVLVAVALRAMGRAWWCRAGDTGLWSGEVFSRHNSQHLVDPYTFTHVLHGVAFYALVARVPAHAGPIGEPDRLRDAARGRSSRTPTRSSSATVPPRSLSTTWRQRRQLSATSRPGVGYAAAAALPVWVSAVGFFVVDGLMAFLIATAYC
jgi:hypothetical protein